MIEDDMINEGLERHHLIIAQKIKSAIQNGAEIYEFVEGKMNNRTFVGLVPLENNEGYLLIRDSFNTTIAQSRLTIFET